MSDNIFTFKFPHRSFLPPPQKASLVAHARPHGVPVPLGSFAIFQQTMGALVLRTVLKVDIVVVGKRHKGLFRLDVPA